LCLSIIPNPVRWSHSDYKTKIVRMGSLTFFLHLTFFTSQINLATETWQPLYTVQNMKFPYKYFFGEIYYKKMWWLKHIYTNTYFNIFFFSVAWWSAWSATGARCADSKIYFFFVWLNLKWGICKGGIIEGSKRIWASFWFFFRNYIF